MKFIAHRINSLAELLALPTEYGAEIDLRDHGLELILQHDPFSNGEAAELFFRHYQHGTLILNIKSERIEHQVLELLQKNAITDYFFLDSSFPMINLLSSQGESRMAVRFSEYEGLDTVMAMKGRVEWVWVDCFTRLPLTREIADKLQSAGFKLCLVSPELQGRPDDIPVYATYLEEQGIRLDAVCTKTYQMPQWEAYRQFCDQTTASAPQG